MNHIDLASFHDELKLATAELSGGIEVPYVRAGNGAPLLFVHGSLCDYRYWKPQVSELSQLYDCVVPSLTHYWPALPRDEISTFSWSNHVGELGAFVTQLGLGPVHLVGHSRGGCVAFHLAVRFPQLVATLTLADPGGTVDQGDEARPQLPVAVNALRARAASLIAGGESEAGLELFVDSVSKPGFWKKSSSDFRTMAAHNAHTLALQFNDPLPPYSPAVAGRVRCPTMLIDGEKSPRMFRRNVDALEKWMKDVRRFTIRGASHAMNLAHPSAFNRHIHEFIQSMGRAGVDASSHSREIQARRAE